MAHIPYEQLKDLELELKSIRTLLSIKEKKPGVFYFKSKPFLHFHDKDGFRFAHVSDGKDWKRVVIDFNANQKQKKDFLKNVKQIHSALLL
jgi:hypothetical protein